MPKKTDRLGDAKSSAVKTKQDLTERPKGQGLSKGAMAAERASAGIGTDDRDPDNWFRPTKRS
jgi:hypothetical protein